jgi:hypothetical protein
MSNGITGLRGYQEGDLVEDPEDGPGWFARMRERARQGRRESTQPRADMGTAGRFPGLGMKLPLFARQFAADISGNFLRDKLGMGRLGDAIGSQEINAGDLSPAEYRALQESVVRAMERGGPNAALTYDDYGLDDLADYVSVVAGRAVPQKFRGEVDERKAEWVQGLLDQGLGLEQIENRYAQGPFARAKSLQSLKDLEGGQGPLEALSSSPAAFSLAGTIGGARIRKDPETGEYWVEDEYDFNDAANLPEDASFWADAAAEGFLPTPGNLYGQARNIGKHYGSRPGEGSAVRINLGDLVPREEGPSRMTRGLGWLRNLFDRDGDDVRVAETELARAPVETPLPNRPAAIPLPELESDVDRLRRRLTDIPIPDLHSQ